MINNIDMNNVGQSLYQYLPGLPRTLALCMLPTFLLTMPSAQACQPLPPQLSVLHCPLLRFNVPATVGEYAGFKMAVSFDSFNHKFVMNLKGQLSHNLEVGSVRLFPVFRKSFLPVLTSGHHVQKFPALRFLPRKRCNNHKTNQISIIVRDGNYKVPIDLAGISGYNGIEVIYLLGMAFAFPPYKKEVYG